MDELTYEKALTSYKALSVVYEETCLKAGMMNPSEQELNRLSVTAIMLNTFKTCIDLKVDSLLVSSMIMAWAAITTTSNPRLQILTDVMKETMLAIIHNSAYTNQ